MNDGAAADNPDGTNGEGRPKQNTPTTQDRYNLSVRNTVVNGEYPEEEFSSRPPSEAQNTQGSSSFDINEIYQPQERVKLDLNQLMKSQRTKKIPNSGHPMASIQKEKEKQVLDQQLFDKHYGYRRVDLTLGRKIHWHFKQIGKWGLKEWCSFLRGRVPISQWLPNYNWRKWTVSDVIGGLMVSIMSVPQGLAYGFLVGVPPNYGLITGIFAPPIYAIFGTSRHCSPGSFAIVALMVGTAVQQYSSPVPQNTNQIYNATSSTVCCGKEEVDVAAEDAVAIATAVTLLIGLSQIFFGLLNAGLLAVWLSDHLVQGLTSGAAVHVLTSQLKSMTGVTGLPPTSEPFGVIRFYLCFVSRAYTFNLPCVITSVISVFLLLSSSYFIDPILKKWTNVKFPMEFFLVIFSTLFQWLGHNTKYNGITQPIVGDVTSGLVPPAIPDLGRAQDMVGSALSIAIVSFVIHIALAKLVSKKLDYEIDANQEWFALGAMHTFSSVFGCFAGGSSLGRTMMQVKFGTKTQLSTIVCASILVVFVYGASTLIYYLPKAVLASIVVVAMKDMFIQLFRAFRLCKESIVDFLIFLVTLLSVITINVNYGLIIGVTFALMTVVFRTQWAESTCMGRIPGTSDFKGLGHYTKAEEIPGIKVFRFDAPLYFANSELFISRMYKACGVNPVIVRATLNEQEAKKKNEEKTSMNSVETEKLLPDTKGRPETGEPSEEQQNEENLEQSHQLTHIIVDCSSIPYVDSMGMDALAQTHNDYKSIGISVLFAHCKVAVRQSLEQCNYYEKVPKNRMFVSLHDAVEQATKEQRTPTPPKRAVVDTMDSTKPPEAVAHSPKPKSAPYARQDADVMMEPEMKTQSPGFSPASTPPSAVKTFQAESRKRRLKKDGLDVTQLL